MNTITIEVNIAQVFVNKSGKFGNPVGVVVSGVLGLIDEEKQLIATKLNFSETVFVDSSEAISSVSIFSPIHKVVFAGHAILGTFYFINQCLGRNVDSIKCGKEIVKANKRNGIYFVTAPLSIMPHWSFEELGSPELVESLTKEEVSNKKHTVVWAWINKENRLIRARTFAPDWGIPEDQANGSGSMMLAAKLGTKIEILHGEGSTIYAVPHTLRSAEVGGLVKLTGKSDIKI